MMRIVFVEKKGFGKRVINSRLKKHDLSFFNESLSLDNLSLVKKADVISTFIYSKITDDVLKKLPRLKLIAVRATGFDNVDIVACKKRGVAVCNVPSYGENTVAEHTFALILALSRKVHKSYLRSLKNDFSTDGLMGFDLEGKTLGVVGAGRIGKHVIKIARGFEMKVLAFDHHKDSFLADEMGFKYVSLPDLFKRSDIVSLHVPYTKENHHLINAAAFKSMKKGAIIINTARGGLIDTPALVKALQSRALGGAGLDVIEGEDFIKEEKQLLYDEDKIRALEILAKDHRLFELDNVVFTPHIAFFSQEALMRILVTTLDNILSFDSGDHSGRCFVC